MDLAGHEKYLKTTIHGVSAGMADYALILVNSRHPPTHMTQHHLNLCCSFGIPVVVCFTKIDGCPEHAFKTCKKDVVKMLRAGDVGKKPFAVRNEEDIDTCVGKLHSLAPLVETSYVTGQGIDLLQKLLFALPKRRRHEKKLNRPFEFLVEDIFNVPGVGAVVSGFVNAGELVVGANSHVFVGQTDDGTFMKTVAKSAHIARINTNHVTAGQSACLAFSLNKDLRKKLRRGMVVLRESPTSTKEFDAEICVLKGEGTTIRRSYQAYVHILNVRQSAYARNIEIVNNNTMGLPKSATDGEDEEFIVLRPGSRAKVRFEFAKRPVRCWMWCMCVCSRASKIHHVLIQFLFVYLICAWIRDWSDVVIVLTFRRVSILGRLLESNATVLKRAGMMPQSVRAAVPEGAETTAEVSASTVSTNCRTRINWSFSEMGGGLTASRNARPTSNATSSFSGCVVLCSPNELALFDKVVEALSCQSLTKTTSPDGFIEF
jgi:selenocysteine-specific translation elongation factor